MQDWSEKQALHEAFKVLKSFINLFQQVCQSFKYVSWPFWAFWTCYVISMNDSKLQKHGPLMHTFNTKNIKQAQSNKHAKF
jgi:hypothetical protein